MTLPGLDPVYWMHHASPELRAAAGAYLRYEGMTPTQIALLGDYLRQWIEAPGFTGPEVEALRADARDLGSRPRIEAWLHRAMEAGVDPL